jgi:triacylglycerol lipase
VATTPDDVLSPTVASRIATNAYFTLGRWIDFKKGNGVVPAGVESDANIHNRVLGDGKTGKNQPEGKQINPTLQGTGFGSDGKLGSIHTGMTGYNTTSGFGYTLTFSKNRRKHVVLALRGTRPEMSWKPDLFTDARGALTQCGALGLVHKGFKHCYDTIMPGIERDSSLIGSADTVHVVGHSLGGGIATLIAGHYAQAGKAVRLYTFGSPRVGGMGSHLFIEDLIGKQNIFRVAHDLDPITLVGPFPYVHVNGGRRDDNNMTLVSPTPRFISMSNHDMNEYMKSVDGLDWDGVRLAAKRVDKDNSLLVTWRQQVGEGHWVQAASVFSLAVLLKMLNYALKALGTAAIIAVTGIDLVAEILHAGIYKSVQLGGLILSLLGDAAKWAGVQMGKGAQFTADVIATILAKMLAALRGVVAQALAHPERFLAPLPLVMASSWALQNVGMI